MPFSPPTALTLEASYDWCRRLTRQTAGNFYYSFLTLPADCFREMCALYAFMRLSDDLGDDETIPIPQRIDRLAEWRAALAHALDHEQYDHEVFPALADVVARHRIPHEYLFAVLDGVRDDLEPTGFETFDELSKYCYRVAGAVGQCCIHLWGFTDPQALARAVDCGLAFQLTNILRDLREDADRGRVYLPAEDLHRFGYTPEDLAARTQDERFVALMRFEVERARTYYRRAEELFPLLEPCGRPILAAMLRIYGGLLDQIERRKYDVFSRRVRLPRWRKLAITFDCLARHRWFTRAMPRPTTLGERGASAPRSENLTRSEEPRGSRPPLANPE